MPAFVPAQASTQRAIKSGLDRVVAAVSLLALLPVFVVVAAAVLLSSRGPVFYLQTRIGHRGKPFRMVKFRSMRQDADSLIEELRAENDADDGLLFKLRADPRVTGVGRFLRKYSLDELPQLVNVLTGSMSLVGPRPALPVEVEQYDARVRRRLLVKPGLTGSWQVAGRSDLPWGEAVRLDLNYVDEWSLGLDLRILARTPGAVLRATGAY
jgi:lipopolysaccharide/colanic/teichoic acid biosynthesis glycosyltransferase